jgi:hypothetical protein
MSRIETSSRMSMAGVFAKGVPSSAACVSKIHCSNAAIRQFSQTHYPTFHLSREISYWTIFTLSQLTCLIVHFNKESRMSFRSCERSVSATTVSIGRKASETWRNRLLLGVTLQKGDVSRTSILLRGRLLNFCIFCSQYLEFCG